jgi:type II restriction enzyme
MTNATNDKLDKLVLETLEILGVLGIPVADLPKRRKEKMAKAFLAVAGMKTTSSWVDVKDLNSGHKLLSREVLRYMNQHLKEKIADGSYDDIRRKDLVLPVEAGIVIKSVDNPLANTNDGTRRYALSPEYATLIRQYDTDTWDANLKTFLSGTQTLTDRLNKQRQLATIPVKLKSGAELLFSPSFHNQLQKAIIEEFLPRFGYGAEVLYVGDTEDKYLYLDKQTLKKLGFFEMAHDKLPDVLAFSKKKNWLYLIEAVHTSGEISELRKLTLTELAKKCSAELVFITAFLDRDTFRKYVKNIAWETEVWTASDPDHMVHFNGDKFLGPHT